MDFSVGDVLSGKGIQYGKYCGTETITNSDFFKIEDLTKNATHYVPVDCVEALRKLPSKQEVMNKLKMFDESKLIDVDEVEGSRYKFFKAKLEQISFEKNLEVMHDMCSLMSDGLLNSSEKKLYSQLKEKIGLEISYILGKNLDEVNLMLDFSSTRN